MNNRDNNNKRFESYPRPTETDNQLKNQPEYIDELSEKDDDKQEVKDERTETESTKRDKQAER